MGELAGGEADGRQQQQLQETGDDVFGLLQWQPQQEQDQPSYVYMPTDPGIRLLAMPRCQLAGPSDLRGIKHASYSQVHHHQQQQQQEQGNGSYPKAQQLLQELAAFCRGASPSSAAGPSAGDHLSTSQPLPAGCSYQINHLTSKKIRDHDSRLQDVPSSTQPQASKQHKKKSKKQQPQHMMDAPTSGPRLSVNSLAVVQHMKASMQALSEKHLGELSR